MYLPNTDTMASLANLAPRYIYSNCSYYNNCNSTWSRWGRWVLAGILIFVGLLVLLFILFMGRRRRRRSGFNNTTSTPMTTNYGYSNGGAPASGYAGATYPQTEQYAPPQGPPPTYGGGGANQGYYGQTSGVAEPQNVYQPHNK